MLSSDYKAEFKLLSRNRDVVHVFPMTGCCVTTIFQKAREFYQTAEGESSMALLPKTPGIPAEKYIREGCKEEFEIFCEEVKKLCLYDGQDRVIEVTQVGRFAVQIDDRRQE